jgi:hypothetical protein
MNTTWHILFIGIAFFQLLFMGVQWVLFRRKEYLFYIGYIFFACAYILFRVNNATGFLGLHLHPWVQEFLDQPLAVLSYYMYLLFTRHFLSLKTLQPKVYRYSLIIEAIFIVFLLGKLGSIPFNLPHTVSAYVYMVSVLVMAAFVVPMIVLMLKQKNILNNFLVWGSAFYIGGGVIGMLSAMLMLNLGKNSLTVLLGVEIGILAELLLLNTGFALKNRILQQQVIQGQQKMMEQLMKNKNRPSDE